MVREKEKQKLVGEKKKGERANQKRKTDKEIIKGRERYNQSYERERERG